MSNKIYYVVNTPATEHQESDMISEAPLKSLDGSLTVIKINKDVHGDCPDCMDGEVNVVLGPLEHNEFITYIRENASLYRERY